MERPDKPAGYAVPGGDYVLEAYDDKGVWGVHPLSSPLEPVALRVYENYTLRIPEQAQHDLNLKPEENAQLVRNEKDVVILRITRDFTLAELAGKGIIMRKE